MKIEYLLFNILVFFPAFIGKLIFFREFFRKEKKLLMSIIIVALIYVIKDIFSNNVLWKFNDDYILGVRFFGLPIEEILFFFTVPYSTLFLFLIIEKFFKDKKIKIKLWWLISLSIIFFFLLMISLTKTKLYFFYIASFFYLTFLLVKNHFSLNLIRFYILVFFLTLVFNFYLTARPVVIYNQEYLLGIKILTIPVEDFIYSFSLFNLLIYFFKIKFKTLKS